MRTPLYGLHNELGASFVDFAGFDMPVRYSTGTIKEHLHTRKQAGFFDISHMGVIRAQSNITAIQLEQLTPANLGILEPEKQKYALLTNDQGGIEDDMMVIRMPDTWYLVVNASRKQHDLEWMRARLPQANFELLSDYSIVALQGPQAASVLSQHLSGVDKMRFLCVRCFSSDGFEIIVSRSGYTGEDGFELIVPNEYVVELSRNLIKDERVLPVGLGARDTLRLEAGLSLYGHEIDENTTPASAELMWSVAKNKELSCAGARIIENERDNKPSYTLIGAITDEKLPMRARDPVHLSFPDGISDEPVGVVTSGSYSPTLGKPIALIRMLRAHIHSSICVLKRGKTIPITKTKLPFVQHRYQR